MRLASALLWLGACSVADPDPPTQTPLDTDTAGDPCALYTWDVVGGPYLRTWCAPCHSADLPAPQRSGAPVGVDLQDEDDVLRQLDRVRARATGPSPTMPPAGAPDAVEVDRFARWLDCLEGP